jgi:hypothetical protein
MVGDFQTQDYEMVREFLSPSEADLLKAHVLRPCQLDKGMCIDGLVGGAVSLRDPLFDALLLQPIPTLSALSDRALLPTYSYPEGYLEGAALPKSTHRQACEVSATVCVPVEPSEPWPIHLDEQSATEVRLQPGDSLIYKGCKVPHWQRPFAGRPCPQVFLHCVDLDGPHTEHAFDAEAVEGRLGDCPGWEDAVACLARLTIYQEMLAERAATKEQS